MKSPQYLYFKIRFTFPIIIGASLLLLFSFSTELLSESYSGYLWDDYKAQTDWGRVKVRSITRLEESKPEREEGFGFYHKIFGAGVFRSQKGGENKDEAGKYIGAVTGNPQFGFYYQSGSSFLSMTLAPRVIASESKLIEEKRNSVWDAEGIVSMGTTVQNVRVNLEGGRGWQRLDGFGFLFNGMANYGQIQLAKNEIISLSLISLRMKPEEESFNPKAWNYQRKEIWGGAIRSNDLLFWENLQFFGYVYKEPKLVTSDNQLTPNSTFGAFLYTGFEFRSKNFWENTSVDLSVIRLTGNRKFKSYPWEESKQSTNSILAYASVHGELQNILLSLSGLYTKKDKKERSDSESNGYAAPLAEPRVMGGYSSFLLYESVSLTNDRVFYDILDKKTPGFENKGIRMIGIQSGYQFYSFLRGDIFINRSYSEMGKGTEIILKTTSHLEQWVNGFISASVAYAKVEQNGENNREFFRIYLSSGFQF
ncbi:hypothetical protein LPTSP3_g33450 [Leptospira kobayashii]|uniref:Outer membrane protein n=1 Tax=Leptospira kobayashii TaxID=1917830 RepID=A0ABN6KNF0_9LEPT|nr:hypothetical protein [Leptospira kobayashii]BDA80415.1 hypothetical protein LPTSP3_g33450 [Leptospira kobayashii]